MPSHIEPVEFSPLSATRSAWACQALQKLDIEKRICGETPAYLLTVRGFPGLRIVLKDESVQPSGSLKHRLARSLFETAIASGDIHAGTHVIEASSGSTAVSEAYFAKILGLSFSAVMPRSTTADKIEAVKVLGGQCKFTNAACDISSTAMALADNDNGYFMNQFGNAVHATNWRDDGSIANEMFRQIRLLTGSHADQIVLGAGTGGTFTTFGRAARYRGVPTSFCLADPPSSAFHRAFPSWRAQWCEAPRPSVIEGIGRPTLEPSFYPSLVDRCEVIPDVESLAAMRWLSGVLERPVGGSTGTSLAAALRIARQMRRADHNKAKPLIIGMLICDSGNRYARTLFDDSWLEQHGIRPRAMFDRLVTELGEANVVRHV